MKERISSAPDVIGIQTHPIDRPPRQDALGKAFVFTPDVARIMAEHLQEIGHEQYGTFSTNDEIFRQRVEKQLGRTGAGMIVEIGEYAGEHISPRTIYPVPLEMLESA